MESIKRYILYLFVIVLIFGGCKKGSENPVETQPITLTQEEQQKIIVAHDSIMPSADSLLSSPDPIQGFTKMLSYYKNLPGVENAWVTGQGLYVKFTKGGIISWTLGSNSFKPPYVGDGSIIKNQGHGFNPTEFIGNSNICLINQQYNDESREFGREVIHDLSILLSKNNYNVTVKNGADANLDFMKNHLKDYGTIFYISHGGYDGNYTWISTGEEGSFVDLLLHNLVAWVNLEIQLKTNYETRNGKIIPVRYYAFSEKFITKEYKQGDFPHSMIYLVACQGLKSKKISDAFISKGTAAVVGWDESNCIGQYTGELLFYAMLGGEDLEGAYNSLPAEAKDDNCEIAAGANLVYYPSSGGTVQLAKPIEAKLYFDLPQNGTSYSERTLTMSGYLINGSQITNGTVELNGIATVLTASGVSFSQPLEINHGLNTLKIGCNGVLQSNKFVHIDTSFSLMGDFPILDLWTELRWNNSSSDVDLHLLPPNSDITDLWTNTDCYYQNKVTSWGGNLDVDDIDGYGPEHITLPTASFSGTYRLFVHYYDDYGTGSSDASVTVAARDGTKHHFGPYHLVNDSGAGYGDLWEVCTITFPSGVITPVNQPYYLGSLMKGIHIKEK